MISEPQRQAYLEAMGITCYLPRLQLPGARPSEPCEWPVEAEPASAVATGSAPVEQSPRTPDIGDPNRAAAAQDLLKESGGAAARPTPARREPEPRAPRETPRFSLSVVRAGDTVIVDEGLTGDTDPRAYTGLLQNLLFALGAGSPQPAVEAFVWPVSRGRGHHVDQSATAAREALAAFLAKQVQQTGARQLVVMGETAHQYIEALPAKAGVLEQHSGFAVRAIVTRSAARALREPALKRQIWDDLQPLLTAER